MVTKEQAMNCREFIQIARYNPHPCSAYPFVAVTDEAIIQLPNPVKWRANGKCKTWKTRPDEFKLPIKHGLYVCGYITHENAHLFNVVEK